MKAFKITDSYWGQLLPRTPQNSEVPLNRVGEHCICGLHQGCDCLNSLMSRFLCAWVGLKHRRAVLCSLLRLSSLAGQTWAETTPVVPVVRDSEWTKPCPSVGSDWTRGGASSWGAKRTVSWRAVAWMQLGYPWNWNLNRTFSFWLGSVSLLSIKVVFSFFN